MNIEWIYASQRMPENNIEYTKYKKLLVYTSDCGAEAAFVDKSGVITDAEDGIITKSVVAWCYMKDINPPTKEII